MNTLTIFNYNGNSITFNNGDSVMVNATEMAKPFGKRPLEWLSNQSTKDYIDALSKVRNLTLADLVIVRKGGDSPGTWMHEDVAIEFARWLAPEFAIWTNDRFKELMTTGTTSLMSDDDKILCAFNILQNRVNLLAEKNKQLTTKIEEDKPKVATAELFVASKDSISVRQFSMILCSKGYRTGRTRLFQWFRDNGYLDANNIPYSKYSHLFDVMEDVNKSSRNFNIKIHSITYITPKGQSYFAQKLLFGIEEPSLF